MPTLQRTALAALMIAFTAALVSAGCGSDQLGTASESRSSGGRAAMPVVTTSAINLTRLYDTNEVNADVKYKGRTLRVTGEVDEIGSDLFGDYYVELVGHRDWRTVKCTFSGDDQIAELAKLSPGDVVQVYGVLDGKLITSVALKRCRLSS